MNRHTKKHVNEVLRGSYNAFGIRRWWDRPRVQLDGQTPAQAWASDKERVVKLAEYLNSTVRGDMR